MKSDEYKKVGGRCRETVYLMRHRVIKVPGRGYRCKYCDKTMSDIRYEAKRRKRA